MGKQVWKRFLKNKLALLGIALILIMTLFSVFGPIFSPSFL